MAFNGKEFKFIVRYYNSFAKYSSFWDSGKLFGNVFNVFVKGSSTLKNTF